MACGGYSIGGPQKEVTIRGFRFEASKPRLLELGPKLGAVSLQELPWDLHARECLGISKPGYQSAASNLKILGNAQPRGSLDAPYGCLKCERIVDVSV